MSYNGHRNRSAWNVSLWIANDEGLYRLALDCLRDARICRRTREYAAELFLQALADINVTSTPDGTRYTKTNVRLAMVGL